MPNSARPAATRPVAAVPAAALVVALAACASSGASSTPSTAATAQLGRTVVETASGASYEVRTTTDDRSLDAVFGTTPDKLWAVLPLVFDSLGVKLTTMNSAARSLGAQNLRMRRRLGGEAMSRSLSCGIGATGENNADTYDVFLTLMSSVEPAPDGRAVVRTWLQGNARPTGTSGNPVRCASTGWLERRIAQLVALRVTP